MSKFRLVLSSVFLLVAAGASLSCGPDSKQNDEIQSALAAISVRLDSMDDKLNQLQVDNNARASLKAEPAAASDLAVSTATYQPNDSLLDDPFLGDKHGEILVMVFSNYQCKPCRLFHKTSFELLRQKYGKSEKIQLVFRDFPLETNEQAIPAAALAHCAGESGGYWKMFDLLNSHIEQVDQGSLKSVAEKYDRAKAGKLMQCAESGRYAEEIERDRKDGIALGAKGAPGTFVGRREHSGNFAGVFIRGAQPEALIDREIHRLGGASSSTPQ